MPSGSMSPIEALRAVVSIVGLLASAWGHQHAGDGVLAFARPIRARMVGRRRTQMIGYVAIFAIIGAQTALVASLPDQPVLSLPTITSGLAFFLIAVIVLYLALHQATGWVSFQQIVAQTPLVPSVEETAAAGRELGHIAASQLALVVGAIELVCQDPALAEEHRVLLEQACVSAEATAARVREIHQYIRRLDPTWHAGSDERD
jgi:hypothetical protein